MRPQNTRSRALRRAAVAGACGALLLSALASTGDATTTGSRAATATRSVDTAHLVTAFAPRDRTFAESVAVNSDGSLFVSKTVFGDAANHGRIVRVSPREVKRDFGPRIRLGTDGVLLGVAIDRQDRVYVGRVHLSGDKPGSVLRVTRHRIIRVATLPVGAMPNGLAFHEGRLYVSDSVGGAIWRFRPSDRDRMLTDPWVRGAALRPTEPGQFGVNGIAFWGDTLFAVNYSKGLLAKVPQGPRGNPGDITIVTRRARLHTADGIAFDRHGHLWVVTTGTQNDAGDLVHQRLLLMTRAGAVWDTTTDARWMNFPTMLALGRTPATRMRMFVTNGAFAGGRASVMSFLLH